VGAEGAVAPEHAAVGESPFDNNRPSFSTWLAAHPHVFDFDNCPF
jgi:hypothetical protein